VLYEEVEFVCGRCHGEIKPGNAIGAAVKQALTTLFEHKLPRDEVLRVLWLKAAAE
jgi:ferredoxin